MNLMTKTGQPVDLRPHPQNMTISHQQQIPLNSHYQFALAYSPASFPMVQNPAVVHHNHKTAHHQIHPQNHQIYSPLPAPLPPPPQFVQVSSSSGGYTPTYSTVSFSPGSPPAAQPPPPAPQPQPQPQTQPQPQPQQHAQPAFHHASSSSKSSKKMKAVHVQQQQQQHHQQPQQQQQQLQHQQIQPEPSHQQQHHHQEETFAASTEVAPAASTSDVNPGKTDKKSKTKSGGGQRQKSDGTAFNCSKCNKFFSRKPNLLRHEKIHLGERPYQCSLCFKFFSQKAHLKKHLLTHSSEKNNAAAATNASGGEKDAKRMKTFQ